MAVTAHFVQHTHWDREWYFSTEDEQVLADQVFTEVFDELEHNPQANFCLDGQSSIVDEYVAMNPHELPRIRKLVAEGRLFLGPWYTQTDGLLVGDEAMLRNLLIGTTSIRRAYGEPMMIGYLPDTFGFNAQMPTILAHAGIDSFLAYRGIDLDETGGSPYFIWRGLGGQSVRAAFFPQGYMTALITAETLQILTPFTLAMIYPAARAAAKGSGQKDVLIPAGIDQKGIVADVQDVVPRISAVCPGFKFEISSYPAFVGRLRAMEGLPGYQGDLRSGKIGRVHRTIGSVRTQQKIATFELEQALVRRAEPLAVIGRAAGVRVGWGVLERAWKMLLTNQAHDAMGGCVTDNVAEDIAHRTAKAMEIVDGVENIVGKRIAEGLGLGEREVLVFNTEAVPFRGRKVLHVVTPSKNIAFAGSPGAYIVGAVYHPAREHITKIGLTGMKEITEPAYWELDVSVEVELPALGYAVVAFEEAAAPLPELVRPGLGAAGAGAGAGAADRAGTAGAAGPASAAAEVATAEALPAAGPVAIGAAAPVLADDALPVSISNGRYTLSFVEGRLSLATAAGQLFPDLLTLTDQANDGDTYDFSPLAGDAERELRFARAAVTAAPGVQRLTLFGEAELPLDLPDRAGGPAARSAAVAYELELSLAEGSDLIEGVVRVDNQVLSHRMRLRLRCGADAAPVARGPRSIAQIQNGFQRHVTLPVPEDWQKEYAEIPVPFEVFDKSVSVELAGCTLTAFADGLKEYERTATSLCLTLFSTTGELGKPNLLWRPGRASGNTTFEGHVMHHTPLAQEPGLHEVGFGLRVAPGALDELAVARAAAARLAPSVSYQAQKLNVFVNRLDDKLFTAQRPLEVPRELSVLEVPEPLLVSAVLPSATGRDAYVVRLANPGPVPQAIPEGVFAGALAVNALEEPVERPCEVPAYGYASFKFRY